MMRVEWSEIGDGRADRHDGASVMITGWPSIASDGTEASYVLLVPEPACCRGCLPSDPSATVEVLAVAPIPVAGAPVTLRGTWRRLHDDPLGWRYRLTDAVLLAGEVSSSRRFRLTRRGFASTALAPLLCMPMRAVAEEADPPDADVEARRLAEARAFLGERATIDAHSHAGAVLRVRREGGHAPFEPLAAAMREGGLAVACLAIVSDSPTHRVTPEGRIRAFRDPAPGELAAYAERGFARLHALVAEQGLGVVRDAAGLVAARAAAPAVLVAAEGADFLEGRIEGLDLAYEREGLRHLQLTHYRPNELGDIQTETPVHGGLTPFGADVIRRCEAMGIVVDVAHGTHDLVRQAAAIATKPLVLSHTSLTTRPRPLTRRITPDHARIVAATGGLVGIWPPVSVFPDIPALAAGIARMADVIGPDHVGIGTDAMGLVGPSALPDYTLLPRLAAELLGRFSRDETAAILGGNYLRVARACLR